MEVSDNDFPHDMKGSRASQLPSLDALTRSMHGTQLLTPCRDIGTPRGKIVFLNLGPLKYGTFEYAEDTISFCEWYTEVEHEPKPNNDWEGDG